MSLTLETIDTQDAKWAVDAKISPPDKESTWPRSPETDGWTIAHNSLRQELDMFSAALAATVARNAGKAPNDWEIECVRRWWKSHRVHVIAHHENEDKLFMPFLQTKIALPPKLETDHVSLVEHLGRLETLIAAVSTDSVSCIKDLAECWDSYALTMKPHLLEEEHVGLPLMRAFFEPKEIGVMIQKIVGNKDAPKEEMGSFIYFLTETKFRNEFMKQEGIPFFVWYLDFEAKLHYYENEVVVQIDALKSGAPPVPVPAADCCVVC